MKTSAEKWTLLLFVKELVLPQPVSEGEKNGSLLFTGLKVSVMCWQLNLNYFHTFQINNLGDFLTLS